MLFSRSRRIAMLAVTAALTVPALAQPRLEFEVAVIKRSDPSHVGTQVFLQPGGKFAALTAPLKSLVRFAYQVLDNQVTGGAEWVDSEPFDVTAKADSTASSEQLHAMVQTLLADRFHLRLHRETREQTVYALVIGKRGFKLNEAKAAGRGVGIGTPGRLNGRGADIATLASALSGLLGRSVENRTDLKGFYDFALTWTPDDQQANTPGPSLFTAIQEQLGLKLESSKGPVEVLVIDHAERPSGN